MRCESIHQHCPDQVHYIHRLLKKTHPTTREVLYLLSHTATQGLDEFEPVYNSAISVTNKRSMVHYIKTRKQEWIAIRQLKNFKANFSNKPLVRDLYTLDKPYFERGKVNPEKLVIVFTTMYNSFFFSNVALLSFLQQFGVSVLILKDSTLFNYLNGIPGFGDEFTDAVKNLEKFIKNKQFEQVYVSGFSSSGYASLLASCLLPCNGYLGFSIRSDFSADSPISPGKNFTKRVISSLRPELLKNLSEQISANSTTPYRIIYGSLNSYDAEHANNLRNCKNVTVETLTGARHIVISPLLISGHLKKKFRGLISAV